MRIFVYAAMAALVTSNAVALEDCSNRSSGDGEIHKRLECLQRNNEELANQIARLNDQLRHAVRDDGYYSIQTFGGRMCLAADPGGNFLRSCADVPGAKFRLHP